MTSIRSKWFRATITLGALAVLAATLLTSPVGAAKRGVTKAKAKQIAANQVSKVGGPLFINVGEKASDADTLDGVDSTAFLTETETFTRHWSCPGVVFFPIDAADTWLTDDSLRYRTGAAGTGLFRCGVHLPDGATVTQVSFTVEDSSTTEDVTLMSLWRANHVTAIGTETSMASVPTSGFMPGAVQFSDTSIDSATIDNANFSYYLQATIGGAGDDVGVYGANITYTITGAQGAGRGATTPTAGTTHGSGG